MGLFGLFYWLINVGILEASSVFSLITEFYKKLYVLMKTLPRDVRYAQQVTSVNKILKEQGERNDTIYTAFLRLAKDHPDKICFYSHKKFWTYREVEVFSNRVAQVMQSAGFQRGDTVAIVMGNRPEYMCLRLGLAQLGVVTSLVNFNLPTRSFEHVIRSVGSRAVIVEGDFSGMVESSRARLRGVETVYQFDGELVEGFVDLNSLLDGAATEPPVVANPPGHEDTAAFFFTSGTNGLPKAGVVPHSRLLLGAVAIQSILDLLPDFDRLYTCLPLYHMAGGGYGAGVATVVGVPVAIARDFSASEFWKDCALFNATCAQYMGEMCSFLMTQLPQESDRGHNLRVLIGNGLRPSLWRAFQDRFGLPSIVELYGSTEGNFHLLNLVDNSKAGAVGFIPRCLPLSWSPVAIVRIDRQTGELVRGEDGFCVRCDEGETGMALGRISYDHPGRSYSANSRKDGIHKKIAKSVFKRGDRWYLTGDLLMMDEFGYVYFKDRIGDSFRCKNINISSVAVESAMKAFIPGKDIAVYGVQVEGTEGCCGMAAIEDATRSVDESQLNAMAPKLKNRIRVYAMPLFIRIIPKLPLSGSFKLLKSALQSEGYDPEKVSDPLYFLDQEINQYIPLTDKVLKKIKNGQFEI